LGGSGTLSCAQWRNVISGRILTPGGLAHVAHGLSREERDRRHRQTQCGLAKQQSLVVQFSWLYNMMGQRMDRPHVSVAVFAYNEEALIGRALDALLRCRDEADLVLHVLINGCTDRTAAIVGARAAADPAIRPILIDRGDKANAWSHYVHDVAPPSALIHVFTDGDVEVAQGSITAFLTRFEEKPYANACASIPLSGRQREQMLPDIRNQDGMPGNLYALRGSFVMRLRQMGVRLPFGLFGEDGVVGGLVQCDLDPRKPWDKDRLTWSENAGYRFDTLSPFRPEHWRIYRNRRRRYALRWHQGRMLWALLAEQGIEAMPAHVIDLYRAKAGSVIPRPCHGIDRFFDWEARRRIARDLAAAEAAKAEDRAHLYS
jgi:glycosyltransferase involved in cell wall biosynthesis